jgi:hypothetical protein
VQVCVFAFLEGQGLDYTEEWFMDELQSELGLLGASFHRPEKNPESYRWIMVRHSGSDTTALYLDGPWVYFTGARKYPGFSHSPIAERMTKGTYRVHRDAPDAHDLILRSFAWWAAEELIRIRTEYLAAA